MDWQTWPRKSIRNKLTFYLEHVYLVDELPFYLCMNQTKILYQITIDGKHERMNIP